MLQKLSILNYQCHDDLRIDFDPQITVIVGQTDTGKSAILRAIRWLIINRPQGEEFIKWGAKKTTVKMLVNDQTVRRHRGNGENTYEVGEQTFKAFGNDVPTEVSKVIGLSETNIQSQFDSPFWLDLTPGELARELNKITNLDEIDEVTAKLSSKIRQLNSEKGVVEERLGEAKTQQDELKFVMVLNKELTKIEDLSKSLVNLQENSSYLEETLNRIYKLDKQVLDGKAKIKAVSGIIKVGKEAIEIQNQQEELKDLIADIRVNKKKVGQKIPDIKKLEGMKNEWEGCSKTCEIVAKLVQQIEAGCGCVERAEEEFVKATKAFDKETGGVCPLCGGKLK